MGLKRKCFVGCECGDCVDVLCYGCFVLERRSNAFGEGRFRGRRRDICCIIFWFECVLLFLSVINVVFSGVIVCVFVYVYESVCILIVVELFERDSLKFVRVRRYRRYVFFC